MTAPGTAEVEAVHPAITALPFPADDASAFDLIVRLRDLFGKSRLSAEDEIRLESLRQARLATAETGATGAAAETFLERLDAEVTLEFIAGPPPARALELVNKTNQFNLNGRRFTDGEWLARLPVPGAFLLQVGYRDKFGPLGAIAVVAGRSTASAVDIDSWVMSCRAFSRRIEYVSIKALFDRFGAAALRFDYQPTARNGPLRAFLESLLHAEPGTPAAHSHRLRDELSAPLSQVDDILT